MAMIRRVLLLVLISARFLDKAEVAGRPGRLVARSHLEFGEDCRHVMVDGLRRDEQLVGNLRIGRSMHRW